MTTVSKRTAGAVMPRCSRTWVGRVSGYSVAMCSITEVSTGKKS